MQWIDKKCQTFVLPLSDAECSGKNSIGSIEVSKVFPSLNRSQLNPRLSNYFKNREYFGLFSIHWAVIQNNVEKYLTS